MIRPYLDNPYHMDMQKCLDSDPCTSWVASRTFQGMSTGTSNTQSNTGDSTASTGSGESTDAQSGTGSGESTDAQSGGTGSTNSRPSTGGYSPSMVGFPLGFNPAVYGLDWDALPKDCME